MTDFHPAPDGPVTGCPVRHGHFHTLYGPEFAADPRSTYAALRRSGPVAPVEIAPGVEAMLVTDYSAALQVLRSPATFVKDSRRWQALSEGKVPQDSPVLPILAWRPSSMFADGDRHTRLRAAVRDSLGRVEPHVLRGMVERSADGLIDRFSPAGEADLMRDYAALLPLQVFIALAGFPVAYEGPVFAATSSVMDASGPEAERLSAEFLGYLQDLVTHKRGRPAADVASWLVTHPSQLTDDELVSELYLLIGAGTQPEQGLIGNMLRLLLVDDDFSEAVYNGTMLVEDSLDEVLWSEPPVANFSVHFAKHDVSIAGIRIPAGVPVLISHSAITEELSRATNQRVGNRAHLAWSAGPHACPAEREARLIATVAVERLLDRLPEIELAVPPEELRWRQGPFHRCPEALPVRFTP
ncbi:cytochrome P450 family protein [Streptomyces flaveolus]|uniref:cytochrome P450 n=1 Tax=Streptomyces flaveolus TaxID=67297 RepID=UPI0036F82561